MLKRSYVIWLLRLGFFGAIAVLILAAPRADVTSTRKGLPYKVTQCDDPALSASERAGCKIWFYAAAGNGRFHAYVLPQRLPVLLDWYRVLNSKERDDRFHAWGI
ncbi:MAG TPA: cytochrome c, partial [Candidatus Angelobacter sp.]|nr:cytochrome c [Candidatus Angelobacter sp.]